MTPDAGPQRTRLEELARRFIVDELPERVTSRRRGFSVPSPRPTAPKDGTRLLGWLIEEADQQHIIGERSARVRLSRRDVKHLQYLRQWIEAVERERTAVE